MKKCHLFALVCAGVLLLASTASARNISLAWNANPESDVAGYKIYYQSDSPTLPFDSIEANEGASPIDVGDLTNFSLSGLSDSRIYYFAVVAYNTGGIESPWSDVVASSWVPALIAPDNGTLADSTAVRFIWESAPAGRNATYTLYYGTDPTLSTLGAPIAGDPPDDRIALFALLLCIIGLAVYAARTPGRRLAAGTLALTLAFGVTACGGGDATTPISGAVPTSPDIPSAPTTVSIFVDSADYYEAYDLQPGQTYYWKVVATESSAPLIPLESVTRSFTIL